MLVDTDVLIDFLRGNEKAVDFLIEHSADLFASAVTVAELYQGVRDGEEKIKLATTLSSIEILPVTTEIAELAGIFRRDNRARIGCGLADCMIAATATHHQLSLATLNAKHFSMIDNVVTPYAKE
ncbi:MAG: putative nucleic acid-binding protein [Verrucomicrobiales bacterium]|jgi:predicted nucleic acid-binding protein